MNIFNKEIDLYYNQHLMSIRSNGKEMGDVYVKDGKICTEGYVGEHEYTNFVDLIHGLQGFGIKIDDFFF
jgi:hypothetical protein